MMYAGDEYYDDDITSGPIDDDDMPLGHCGRDGAHPSHDVYPDRGPHYHCTGAP